MNASSSLAFLQNLGWQEILLILIIILLLFGAKRLPELARSLGKSMKEFKKATSEAEQTFRQAMDEEDNKAKQQQQPPTQRAEAEASKAPVSSDTPAQPQK